MDFVFWDDAFRLRDSAIPGEIESGHSKLLTKQKRLPKRDYYFLGFYNNAALNPSAIFLPSESAKAAYKLFSCIECTAVECKTEAFCVQICKYLLILAEFNRNIYKRRNAYPYSEELVDLLRIYVELEYETLYGNISYMQAAGKLQDSWDDKVKKRVLDVLYIMLPCFYDYHYDFHGGMEPFNVELSRDMHVFQILKSVKLKYQRKIDGFIKKAMREIIHSNGEMNAAVHGLLENGHVSSISKAWTDKSISFLTEQGLHPSLTRAIPESINDCLKLYNISPDLDLSYDLLEVNKSSGMDEIKSITKNPIKSIGENDLNSLADYDIDNNTMDVALNARRFLLPPASISSQYIDCQNEIKVECTDEEYDKDNDPKIPGNGVLRSIDKSMIGTNSTNKKTGNESTSKDSSIGTQCSKGNKSLVKEIIVGRIVISDDDDDDDDDEVIHVVEKQKEQDKSKLTKKYVKNDKNTTLASQPDCINNTISESTDSPLEVLAAQAVEQLKVDIDTANILIDTAESVDEAAAEKCIQPTKVKVVVELLTQQNECEIDTQEFKQNSKRSLIVDTIDSHQCDNESPVNDCNIPDIQSSVIVPISQSEPIDEKVTTAAEPTSDSPIATNSTIENTIGNCESESLHQIQNIDVNSPATSINDMIEFELDKESRSSTPLINEIEAQLLVDKQNDTTKADKQSNIAPQTTSSSNDCKNTSSAPLSNKIQAQLLVDKQDDKQGNIDTQSTSSSNDCKDITDWKNQLTTNSETIPNVKVPKLSLETEQQLISDAIPINCETIINNVDPVTIPVLTASEPTIEIPTVIDSRNDKMDRFIDCQLATENNLITPTLESSQLLVASQNSSSISVNTSNLKNDLQTTAISADRINEPILPILLSELEQETVTPPMSCAELKVNTTDEVIKEAEDNPIDLISINAPTINSEQQAITTEDNLVITLNITPKDVASPACELQSVVSPRVTNNLSTNIIFEDESMTTTESVLSMANPKSEEDQSNINNKTKIFERCEEIENQLPTTLSNIQTNTDVDKLHEDLHNATKSQETICNTKNKSRHPQPKDLQLSPDTNASKNAEDLAKKSPEKNTNHSIETILSPIYKEQLTKSCTADDSQENAKSPKIQKNKKDGAKKKRSIRSKGDLKAFDPIIYSHSNETHDLPKTDIPNEVTSVPTEIRQNSYYNTIPDDGDQTSSYASGREIDPLVRGAMPVTINDDKEEPILRNSGFNVSNTSQNMPNDETPVEEYLFPVLLDMEIQTEQVPSAKETYDVSEIDQTNKDTGDDHPKDGRNDESEIQHDHGRQIIHKIGNRTVTIGKMNKTLYECLPLTKDSDAWITNDCSAGFLSPALRVGHSNEHSDNVASEDVEKLLLSSQYNCSLEVISDIRNLGPQQLFEGGVSSQAADIEVETSPASDQGDDSTINNSKCVMINNSNIRVEVMDPAHINNMVLHPVNVSMSQTEQQQINNEQYRSLGNENDLPTDPLIEINENTVEEILQISNTQIRDEFHDDKDKEQNMDTHIKIIEDVVASASIQTGEISNIPDRNTSKVIVESINTQSMYDTVKTLKEKLSYSQYFTPKQTKQKKGVNKKGNKRNTASPAPKSQTTSNMQSPSIIPSGKNDAKGNINPGSSTNSQQASGTPNAKANIPSTTKNPNDTFNRLLEEYRGCNVSSNSKSQGTTTTSVSTSSTNSNVRTNAKNVITTDAPITQTDDVSLVYKRSIKAAPCMQSLPTSPSNTGNETKKALYAKSPSPGTPHLINPSPNIKSKKYNTMNASITDAEHGSVNINKGSTGSLEGTRNSFVQKSPLHESASMPLLPVCVKNDLSKPNKQNRSQKACNINNLTEKLQQRRTESGNNAAPQGNAKPCQYVSPAYDKDYEDMKKYEQRYRRDVQRPAQRKSGNISQQPQQYMMYPHNAGTIANVPATSTQQPFKQTSSHGFRPDSSMPQSSGNNPHLIPDGVPPPPPPPPQNQSFRPALLLDIHPPCERGCDNCINRNNNHLKVPQKPKKLNRDIYQQIFPTLLTSKNLPHFWKE